MPPLLRDEPSVWEGASVLNFKFTYRCLSIFSQISAGYLHIDICLALAGLKSNGCSDCESICRWENTDREGKQSV